MALNILTPDKMIMFYKIGTTLSTVDNTNTKIAYECPEGYITFHEMKYGGKVVPPIESKPKRGKK